MGKPARRQRGKSGLLVGVRDGGGRTNGTGRRRCVHRTLRSCGLTSFIAASISCSPSHESTTQESDMATGWAGDGAVQDQIDATVKDAIKRVRSQLPQGPSLRRCEECDVERSEEHTSEIQLLMRISYA